MAQHLLSWRPHGDGLAQLTLKIEAVRHGETVTVRLVGRMAAAYLDELRAQLRSSDARLVIDLDQVTLLDDPVVRFLIACEAAGVELRHCAPYVREWMQRERKAGGDVPDARSPDDVDPPPPRTTNW